MGYYHAQPKPLAALNVSAFGGPGATWNYNYSWVCPIAADATADLTDGNTLKVTLYTVLTTPAAGQVRINFASAENPKRRATSPHSPHASGRCVDIAFGVSTPPVSGAWM